jgi:hypothetical protein
MRVAMSEEQRAHDRENLERTDIPGTFSVEADGKSHAFTRVNDVSISGMGIYIDCSFENGKDVVVKYSSTEFGIAIRAKIAWCVKEEDGFKVGVQYSSEDLDANVMMFMTLREHIDDFGEAF